jgi:hypothetical protein
MEAAALEGRQVGGEIDTETALRVLRNGELIVVGRLLLASNETFFCLVEEHRRARADRQLRLQADPR